MSTCDFEMDLGDAGTFEFVIDYQYYPAEEARWPGEWNKPEVVLVNNIMYGGIDWTKQLKKILETNPDFVEACRADWLDEQVEHVLRMAGA